MQKEYKYDDEFKRWARAQQFAYREKVLGDFNENRAPQVLLNDENAKNGLIFYEPFRELILVKITERYGEVAANQLTANMLRSEHIPYNLFTPLETMPDIAAEVFRGIVGMPIKEILEIKIEFAGIADKSEYLNDRTSFDAFVRYEAFDGRTGGIGIEVKYTENEYPLGEKEGRDIAGDNDLYRQMTEESGYFYPDMDIKRFLQENHLRQIWRNHILGYSMKHRGDMDIIHHIHLYPQKNTHFHKYALPDYRKLLTEEGNETFKTLTYENYFALLDKFSERNEEIYLWVKYLRSRYLGIK